MLNLAIVLIMSVFVVAAMIDVHDILRGHRGRDTRQIADERRDLHADLASTQHRGICVPIDDICRDRQRGR